MNKHFKPPIDFDSSRTPMLNIGIVRDVFPRPVGTWLQRRLAVVRLAELEIAINELEEQ